MEKIPSNLSSILKSESEPSISDENVNQDESVLVKDYFKRMENVLQTFESTISLLERFNKSSWTSKIHMID